MIIRYYEHYSNGVPPDTPPQLDLLDTVIHGYYPADATPTDVRVLRQQLSDPALPYLTHNPRLVPPPPLPSLQQPELPLTLHNLVGTSWINIYSGQLSIVEAIGFDEFGRPHADIGETIRAHQIHLLFWLHQPPRLLAERCFPVTLPTVQAQWALYHLDFIAPRCHKTSPDYLTALNVVRQWEMQGYLAREHILAVITKHFGPQQLTLF